MRRTRVAVVVSVVLASTSCGAPAPDALPTPRWRSVAATTCHDVSRACVVADTDDHRVLISSTLESAGIATDPNRCDWRVVVATTTSELPAPLAAELSRVMAPERFAFTTRIVVDKPTTTLFAATENGLRYAARRIATRLRRDATSRCTSEEDVLDYPSFSTRGIVEGFYGDPYSIDERHELLTRMGDLDMNAYLYGPKGDPYVHDHWQSPYPAERADAMRALTSHAHRLGITPIWAVSPAPNVFGYSESTASIRFSSADDFAELAAKLTAMHALGFDRFALFVDDTAPELLWAEDRAAFASPAAAHADLANRMLAHVRMLTPEARLLFVGRDYSEYQPAWSQYNGTLGPLLDPGVDVMWTGPLIYSQTIAVGDAMRIADVLGRPVTIWDNAPETLTPLRGRDAALATVVSGFYSNPVMNEWRMYSRQSFWQTVGGIGLYQWNAEQYDADAAFAWWQTRYP